jgi:hypothetical protein
MEKSIQELHASEDTTAHPRFLRESPAEAGLS